MFRSTVALALLAAACNAGKVGPISDLTRIINGEDAAPEEIPYQVSLQYKNSGSHFCGGSILNSVNVLTAAHCIIGRTSRELKIVAGTNDLSHGGVERNISVIKAHEGYNTGDSYRNDIALLTLEKPLEMKGSVQSVRLPSASQKLYAGEKAVVSGWGRLSHGGKTTNILQRVDIEVSDQSHCEKVYKDHFGMKVDDTQVCADVPEGNKGSCNGDSGGPLTVNGRLTGLVSWAYGCAVPGYPTVYTRVSKYLQWINENTV